MGASLFLVGVSDMTEKQQQHMGQAAEPPEGGKVRSYTILQSHFLARLEQLDKLLDEYEQSPHPDPLLLQVIKKAIYSTLRDCDDNELGEEARAVLSSPSASS